MKIRVQTMVEESLLAKLQQEAKQKGLSLSSLIRLKLIESK